MDISSQVETVNGKLKGVALTAGKSNEQVEQPKPKLVQASLLSKTYNTDFLSGDFR